MFAIGVRRVRFVIEKRTLSALWRSARRARFAFVSFQTRDAVSSVDAGRRRWDEFLPKLKAVQTLADA
jgi:hypothetical protein